MRRLGLTLALLLIACPTQAPRPLPAGPVLRYLALGDSFTIGTGSPPEAAFPSRLAARWRAAGRGVELRNLARNGARTQEVLDEQLPGAGGFQPDLVTLCIGANDIVAGSDDERYRAQLRRIFQALRGAGIPAQRLVVLPQPDWSLAPAATLFAEPAFIEGRILRFNAILQEEAAAAGARYVDLFPLMRRQARAGKFCADGLHPSAAAYEAWAAVLARELAPAAPAAAAPAAAAPR